MQDVSFVDIEGGIEMKVWLIYHGYDGETYESSSYDALIGVVDSEEKAKARILKEATDAVSERIDYLTKEINSIDENHYTYQDLKDELYFYDVQLSSLKIENKSCIIHESNYYESNTYYYEVREVE